MTGENGATTRPLSVVMLGATGAVGGHVARTLVSMTELEALTLLGRRPLEGLSGDHIQQTVIDLSDPRSYQTLLPGHETAICTLGVGQPSRITKEEFVEIDKRVVLAFASACKDAGVRHFELLGSVGADARSRSFYLRTKGELEDGLRDLAFDRLSLFRPSLIITPTNRYGILQGLSLAVWPWLQPVMVGGLRKFRGISVERLGRAMAVNLRESGNVVEVLNWDAIERLAGGDPG